MTIRMSQEDFDAHQARLLKAQGKAIDEVMASPRVERKTRSKYGNKRVKLDGLTFDSKAEARHYRQLKYLEERGEISDLQCQVPFELAPAVHLNGKRRTSPPLRYIADFVFMQDGKRIVEDVKGHATEAYRIKRHLMATVHGINVVEIRQGTK